MFDNFKPTISWDCPKIIKTNCKKCGHKYTIQITSLLEISKFHFIPLVEKTKKCPVCGKKNNNKNRE